MDVRDMPHLHSLIYPDGQMAEFELLTRFFAATKELLTSTLFPSSSLSSPFTSFTSLILDVVVVSPSHVALERSSSYTVVDSLCLNLSASSRRPACCCLHFPAR